VTVRTAARRTRVLSGARDRPVCIEAEPAQLLSFFAPALLVQQIDKPPLSILDASFGPGA
jgi:hypothetical protein